MFHYYIMVDIELEHKQILEDFAEKWLNEQKDTLLLQLVGFIMDKKAKLEEQYGSGEVQKMFNDDDEQDHKQEQEQQ